MAVGLQRTLCMYLSFAGVIYFVFISFCCFIKMEALHLQPGTNATRGFQVLLTAIIYGGIGGWIYYQKYIKEGMNDRDSHQDNQMEEMRSRLIQDY